jgi:hypothetical protein
MCAGYLVMVTDEDNRPTCWNFNQAAAVREIQINSYTVIDRPCAPLYVHLPLTSVQERSGDITLLFTAIQN